MTSTKFFRYSFFFLLESEIVSAIKNAVIQHFSGRKGRKHRALSPCSTSRTPVRGDELTGGEEKDTACQNGAGTSALKSSEHTTFGYQGFHGRNCAAAQSEVTLILCSISHAQVKIRVSFCNL